MEREQNVNSIFPVNFETNMAQGILPELFRDFQVKKWFQSTKTLG